MQEINLKRRGKIPYIPSPSPPLAIVCNSCQHCVIYLWYVVLIYCRIESGGRNGVMNPAFTRMHPTKNVIYSCTESVEENGEIVCWQVCPETGRLTLLSAADAFGTSTCYITIDKVCDEVLSIYMLM